MPYGNDEWLEKHAKERQARQLQQAKLFDDELRKELKIKYQVPDEFMDIAVRIWWDGKED